MPRSIRDSDDEVEAKLGRRTRSVVNSSVADSPLRRSSRIKQSHDSSPDSAKSETNGVPKGKVNNSTTRSRKSSISFGRTTPETLVRTPQKRNLRRNSVTESADMNSPKASLKQNVRSKRAGSEVSSPLCTRVTRNTRARSVDPDSTESDNGVKESAKIKRPYKRASIAPTEPPVAEKDEETYDTDSIITEHTTSDGNTSSFEKSLQEEAKSNNVSVILHDIVESTEMDVSLKSNKSSSMTSSEDNMEVEKIMENKDSKLISELNTNLDSFEKEHDLIILKNEKENSLIIQEINDNKENETANTVPLEQLPTIVSKAILNQENKISKLDVESKTSNILNKLNDSSLLNNSRKSLNANSEEETSSSNINQNDKLNISQDKKFNKSESENSQININLNRSLTKKTKQQDTTDNNAKNSETIEKCSENDKESSNEYILEDNPNDNEKSKEKAETVNVFSSQNQKGVNSDDFFEEEPMEVDEISFNTESLLVQPSQNVTNDSLTGNLDSSTSNEQSLNSSIKKTEEECIKTGSTSKVTLQDEVTSNLSTKQIKETDIDLDESIRNEEIEDEEQIRGLFDDIVAEEWKDDDNTRSSSIHSVPADNIEIGIERKNTVRKESIKPLEVPKQTEKESLEYESDDAVVLRYQDNEKKFKDDIESDNDLELNIDSDHGSKDESTKINKSKQTELIDSKDTIDKIKEKDKLTRRCKSDAYLSKKHESDVKNRKHSLNLEQLNSTKSSKNLNSSKLSSDSLRNKSLSKGSKESLISLNESSKKYTENKETETMKNLSNKLETSTNSSDVFNKSQNSSNLDKNTSDAKDEFGKEKEKERNNKNDSLKDTSIKKVCLKDLVDSESSEEEQTDRNNSLKDYLLQRKKEEKIRFSNSFKDQAASKSDSTNEESMDEDIKKEYNLDGDINIQYSDDNVPADECRDSESEYSDPNDNGSDLADFVVDDEAELEDDNEENEENEDDEDNEDENEEDEEDEENDGNNSVSYKIEYEENKENDVDNKDIDEDDKSDKSGIDLINEEINDGQSNEKQNPKWIATPVSMSTPHKAFRDEKETSCKELLINKNKSPTKLDSSTKILNKSLQREKPSVSDTSKTNAYMEKILKSDLNNTTDYKTPTKKHLVQQKTIKNACTFQTEVELLENSINEDSLNSSSENKKSTISNVSIKKLKDDNSYAEIKTIYEYTSNSLNSKVSKEREQSIERNMEKENESATKIKKKNTPEKSLVDIQNTSSLKRKLETTSESRKKRSINEENREEYTLEEDNLIEIEKSKKSNKKHKNKNKQTEIIVEPETKVVDKTADSKVSVNEPKKKKKQKNHHCESIGNELEKFKPIIIEVADSKLSQNSSEKRKHKKKNILLEQELKENKINVEETVNSRTTQNIRKRKNKKHPEVEQKTEKISEEEITSETSQAKSKDKRNKKQQENEKQTPNKFQKVKINQPSQIKSKEMKNTKNEKTEVKPKNKDDSNSEDFELEKYKALALEEIRKAVKAIESGRKKNMRKQSEENAKRQQQTQKLSKTKEAISSSGTSKKGTKRLSDIGLEEMSDVPTRPHKRQKRKVEPEEIKPSRTMFSFDKHKKYNINVEDMGFNSSKCVPTRGGATTKFEIQNYETLTKTIMKSSTRIYKSKRDLALKNVKKHPMSEVLKNLEKQKAAGKSKNY